MLLAAMVTFFCVLPRNLLLVISHTFPKGLSYKSLEAQQRYFSYRMILVATVSQNLFVRDFVGHCAIIARYVAKRGIGQIRLCETKCQG